MLYQAVRYEPGWNGRDKDFRQRRPKPGGGWLYNLDGVRRVLYRLPELLDADRNLPVFVVAGEKDADTLFALNLVATTNVCGERAEWLDGYSAALAGRNVVVIEDRDSAGRRHAHEVCGSLMCRARSVRRLALPGAKDATAFVIALRRNGVDTPAELREILLDNVNEAARWEPAAA